MKTAIYHQWDQLPESANTLFAHSEKTSIFYSRAWLESLSKYALAEHQTIRLVCVVEDEAVLAILPLLISQRDGLRALSNHFTTLFSVLVSEDGPYEDIMSCLAQGLSRMSENTLRLEPIEANDYNLRALYQSIATCGFTYEDYFRFYNWSHPVNGQSFDEYMKERPANIRNMIKRKQRKFEREHATRVVLYQKENIDQALQDYQTVYLASWKANEFFIDFTPNIVKQFANLGWLRLAVLYSEDKPVAAQIWFVVHRKASIYRLVYDGRWKKYSPGSLLTYYLMRHVIDTDKVSEIDFLTGNERYKQDWMTVRKERVGMYIVKRRQKKRWLYSLIERFKS